MTPLWAGPRATDSSCDDGHVELELSEGLEQLGRACPILEELINTHRRPEFSPVTPGRYFDVLLSSIIGQQLSVKAAATIEQRLRESIGEFTPEAVINAHEDSLRNVGLSRAKTSYAKSLAVGFRDGSIEPEKLMELKDQEAIDLLTKVKGIGPWTAEMFLIFGLGRLDVWSAGDLGLRRALEHFFDSAEPHIADRWRPYRSIAAWYLWEHSDNAASSR